MAKKKTSAAKTALNNSSDNVIIKVIVAFCLAAVCVFAFMVITEAYGIASTFNEVRSAIRTGSIIAAVFTLCALVFTLVSRYKLKKEILTQIGLVLFILGAIFAFGLLALYLYYVKAAQVIYFALPALAILYLIYCIYQKPFFFISVLSFASGFGFYIMSRLQSYASISRLFYLVVGVVALLIIILAAITFLAKKGNGKLFKRLSVIDAKQSYLLMYITSAFFAALLIASIIIGATASYVCLFISMAYFFIMAVYYTVKLM